jgi:hypothetical protein
VVLSVLVGVRCRRGSRSSAWGWVGFKRKEERTRQDGEGNKSVGTVVLWVGVL